jgi:hypothetical protein
MERSIDGPGRSITLTYVGNGISPEAKAAMKARLAAHDLTKAKLNIREGLSLQELNAEQQNKDAGLERQLEDQRALLTRLGTLTDSLGQVRAFRREIMAEAKAQHPDLQWLAVAELPKGAGSTDTLGQVVAAHFTQYPDTAEIHLLANWLDVRLKGQRHVLSITADAPRAAIMRKTGH